MIFKIKNKVIIVLLWLTLGSCIKTDKSDKAISVKIPETAVSRELFTKYTIPDTPEGYLLSSTRKNPISPTPENIKKGEKLYTQYCTHCHGKNGNSDAPMMIKEKYPPPPPFRKRLPTISEGQMFHSIYYGKNQMPDNKNDLTEEQIWLLVIYIKTFIEDQKHNQP